MKKQLSSLDLHFLLKELEVLKDSKIDKIYQPEKNTIIFSLYKQNVGKKLLKINVGQSIFIYEENDQFGENLGFCMLLRKHLDGYFLYDIEQIKPERIIKFYFKIKDVKKNLYIEFFGKGNAVLCDSEDMIINSLVHHEFKDRTVKPRIKYKHPIMQINIFNPRKMNLMELLKNSEKDKIIITIATELGLGGIYSEEACILSSIDKTKNPKDVGDKEIDALLLSIKNIINNKIEPKVIFENGNPIDATPFDFAFYDGYEKKEFLTFNEALFFFYSHFKEVKETEFDKKFKSLQHIIEQQELTIDQLKNEEKELREKGEFIYHKYNLIKEILEEINKASKKYSWKEIKEKLKEHRIVKEVNEKERMIVVEI